MVELGCLVALLILAWLAPARAARPLAAIESALARLPTSGPAQLVIVGLFAVLLRAAFLPWLGPPVPLIPDEYSLLLQAQTFMEGRLANPTHPLWPHFQAMHVNQVPAYGSMYFPGRGLPLALGLLVAGHAWIGVWISFVLFAMSTVWTLRGWTSPKVALVGGLLVVLRLGAGSYWINSYWGGAFTAMGAMLVFGAMPRLLRHPSWAYGLALGLGALILMTTRPFEGGVFCAVLGVFFLPRLLKTGPAHLQRLATRAGVPLASCLAIGLVAMLQHNAATTGDPLRAAYDLNRHQYATTPAFLIQSPISPQPPASEAPPYFDRVYELESEDYVASQESWIGLISFEWVKSSHLAFFYIGLAMAIPFLVGLWGSRRDMPVVGTLVVCFACHLLTSWNFPHYAAPLFPPLLLITVRGLMTLGRWSVNERPVGYVFSRGAFFVAASPLALMTLHLTTGWPDGITNSWSRSCCAVRQSSERSEIVEALEQVPGKDLVVVDDSQSFPKYGDLVYNEPDIDASSVAFAHSLSAASNARLLDYFRDRRIWLLEFTPEGYSLEPIGRGGNGQL
jgi:hypothetical protein